MLAGAAGCGQKPGVADNAAQLTTGLGQGLPENIEIDPETGEIINTDTGEVIAGSLEELQGDLPGDTPGGSTDPSDPSDPSDPEEPGTAPPPSGDEPSGGDATGVSQDVIKLGTHAPLTGAAPVPSDSVSKGKDLYSKWLEKNGKDVHGRRTETVLKNDNYKPSQAVAVCKEMVEKDEVFLLLGAAGTDQIQACARYSAGVGVPYISAGVTEIGLTGLPNYFAITMSYPDQGPLLADFMVSNLGAKGEKNGMLRFDTQNFGDAHNAWVEAMDDAGADVVYDRAVSKNAGSSEAQTVVQEMAAAGVQNVYILVSPTWWIQVLKYANAQAFRPQWVGVGITKTFDTVLTASCPDGNSIDKAKFFAPFPAWIDINKFDPDFTKAVNEFYPEKRGGDDFMVLSWGFSKVIYQLLLKPGAELTRERFVYFAERARNIKTGVLPTLNFAPDDRWGANEVHVSEARCSDRRWHTIQSFVSDF
jgi:branched-chain amino acid transport system substrate-binding protein